MKITTSMTPAGICTIAVIGDLDIYAAREFHSILTSDFENNLSGLTSVIFDLDKMESIDLSAMQLIMQVQKICVENDKDFRVIGRNALIKEFILLTSSDVVVEDRGSKTSVDVSSSVDIGARRQECSGCDHLYVSIRFDRQIFKYGLNPLCCLQSLRESNQILSVKLITSAAPEGLTMEPELCYFGLELTCTPNTSADEISKAFELLLDDCTLETIEPAAPLSEYALLLKTRRAEWEEVESFLLTSKTLLPDQLQVVHALSLLSASEEKNYSTQPKADAPLTENIERQQLETSKLDKLIDLMGELVISSAKNKLLISQVDNARLNESSAMMSRLVEELRETALTLRLIRIGDVFRRYRRVVSDGGQKRGKKISLTIGGGDAELDKSLAEKITDPLLAIFRHAIDHGIECVAERLKRGKAENGVINVKAYHESKSIVIEVADDGVGLDKNKIRDRAVILGLIDKNQKLSESELFQLIFKPAFSMDDKSTRISGRRDGIDFVKTAIETLGGSVAVFSEKGSGTTFVIKLPVAAAILDSFLVDVDKHLYAIPLNMVLDYIEINEKTKVEFIEQKAIRFEGEVLPLINLSDLFQAPEKSVRQKNILIVKYGRDKAGLLVDDFKGEYQAVIKPLGDILQKVRGFSGAAVIGSQELAMVLDIPGLIQSKCAKEERKFKSTTQDNDDYRIH